MKPESALIPRPRVERGEGRKRDELKHRVEIETSSRDERLTLSHPPNPAPLRMTSSPRSLTIWFPVKELGKKKEGRKEMVSDRPQLIAEISKLKRSSVPLTSVKKREKE